jgi:predicted solute-binding protein
MFALTAVKSDAIKSTLPLHEFKTKHEEIEIECFINRTKRLGVRRKKTTNSCVH